MGELRSRATLNTTGRHAGLKAEEIGVQNKL